MTNIRLSSDSGESLIVKALGTVAIFIALLPIVTLYYGWAISTMWNDVMPALFGLRTLNYSEAIVLALMLSALRAWPRPNRDAENDDKYRIYIPLLQPLVAVVLIKLIIWLWPITQTVRL